MGITGLIPFLEKASSKVHLKELRGSTVAIDSYCWLHKGVYSCADKLVRGEDSDRYINYCMKYVEMLLSFNIKPILVFDGQHLPAKALTEKRRRESRQESKKRAAELLRLGKVEQARSHMRRCIDITHEMALRLIRECRLRNVDCIVAPYEADAQMAWLNKVGIAQYVITEDSDLTLFGARNIIFKLELSGYGLLVKAEKLHLTMGCQENLYNFDKFRRMCILSGCDYLDSLPGIGLMKACKFMLKAEEEDIRIALKKIPQYLNMKKLEVDDEYIENFLKAEATFKHMFIYNPIERKMERLNPLEDYQTDESYCSNAGMILGNEEQALNLALGNLNPLTLKQLDNWHPDNDFDLSQTPAKHIKRAKHKSIWQSNFQVGDKNRTRKLNLSGCALYFKKVDFISKTIKQDISENINMENGKSDEADILKIYKEEAVEQRALQSKRKRCFTESENDTPGSPPQSKSPRVTRNNPFAKTSRRYNAESQSNATAICANSSLLKVLSPKKFKQETERKNSFQRNVLMTEEVEVRSRFFEENVKLVQSSTIFAVAGSNSTIQSTVDVSDEIESIERLSQQHAESQALLYHSPSPKKSSVEKHDEKIDALPLSHTDSGIESLITTENDITSEIVEINSTPIIIDESDGDLEGQQCHNNVISSTISKSIKLDKERVKKSLRMGLSKNETKKQKLKIAHVAKSQDNSSQIQTRLSMFGFKKRASLK